MWIKLALLLLCYLYEQTTGSTSSTFMTSLTSTTLSTSSPITSPSTIASTTSSSTTSSTTTSMTNSTMAMVIAFFTSNMSTTTTEQSSITSDTTAFTSVTTEATNSHETTGLTSTITTVTYQSKSSASTITGSLSLTSNNPVNGTSLESTTTTVFSTSTNPKGMSDTSHSYPVTSSDSVNKSDTPTTTPDLQTILSAAIVPVVVCSTVALAVFFYLRHSRRKAKGGTDKKVTSKSIDILDFDNVLRDMNANSQLKYSEEFMALAPVGKEYSKDVAGLEANREKNRYTDIKPYDISRVKLSINPEDESDYINASWIPGYFSRRQYIAAQGPMPSTQDDFWRMIWEYNSRIIVMLTKTVENNRIKCCQYWPSDREVVMYGDIAVSIIDETETDSWITREMNVSMGQQKRLVKQCFFTKWPDMKTPEDSSSIIDFIRMVRSYCPIRGSSPLVVHCSAGVGRTGAFIALDTAMYQIEEEEKVDIFGIVYKMRLNRVSMVQNERQYIFIYETVADLIRNHQEEKKKKSNGQADFFIGDMPKSDSISNNLIYQNIDASNSALVINEDVRNLL